MPTISFALFLTLFRMIFSLFCMCPLVYYDALCCLLVLKIVTVGSLFIVSITDYFDGYCARAWGQVSSVGAVLDLIADKIFLVSTAIALTAAGKVHCYWVTLLIGRELLVTGLRTIALIHGFSVSVSSYGKLKMVFITISLWWLVVDPLVWIVQTWWVWFIQYLLLCVTLIISWYSAWNYYQQFLKIYGKINSSYN